MCLALGDREYAVFAAAALTMVMTFIGVGVGHTGLFVHAIMPTHVALDRKPTTASGVWAFIWLFPGVCMHVGLETARPVKCLPTLIANVAAGTCRPARSGMCRHWDRMH